MPDDFDLTIGGPGVPEVDADAGDVDDELGYDLDAGPGVPVAVVTEAQVRDILDGAGRAASVPPLNMGVPDLWKFSRDELDGLVPPLTRVINKRPPLARAVAKGDEVFVLLQLASYFGRRGDVIVETRKRAREEDPNGVGEREARSVAPRSDPAAQQGARGATDLGADVGRGPASEY